MITWHSYTEHGPSQNYLGFEAFWAFAKYFGFLWNDKILVFGLIVRPGQCARVYQTYLLSKYGLENSSSPLHYLRNPRVRALTSRNRHIHAYNLVILWIRFCVPFGSEIPNIGASLDLYFGFKTTEVAWTVETIGLAPTGPSCNAKCPAERYWERLIMWNSPHWKSGIVGLHQYFIQPREPPNHIWARSAKAASRPLICAVQFILQ